tara:strand:- start:542 stop:1102 length:561 start_codon:yes stop_codon:yes gene_type:complete
MRTEKKKILQKTKYLEKLGLKQTPMNSQDFECGTHIMYSFPNIDAVIKFVNIMPSVVAGKTGRHNYTEWDQILNGEGAAHPLMNPYKMSANKNCRRSLTKEMLPRSLDILNRTVMIPTNPQHNEQQINNMITNIDIAANYAFGKMGNSNIESIRSELKNIEQIESQKYDLDEDAYGINEPSNNRIQ